MPGLYANSYAMSLALYHTTSMFSFHFQAKTNLKHAWKVLGCVGIIDENTSLFVKEVNSALIASFHLF